MKKNKFSSIFPKKRWLISFWLIGCLLYVAACQDSKHNSRMIAFFIKGNEALHKEDYKTALRYYDAGIQIDSTFADIFNNRGIVYFETIDLDNALKDYNQALKIKPDFYNAYFNRANLYFELAEYEAAAQDFSKVIQAYPDSAEVYFYRAKSYLQNGDYDAAYQDLNKVLQKQPKNAQALDSRGYIQLKRRQYQEAQKDLEKALSLDKDLDLAWTNLAILENLKENTDPKIVQSHFEKALEIQPEEVYTLTQRALYYLAKDQKELAQEDLKKASAIAPENLQTLFAKAAFLRKDMNCKEAYPLLESTQKDKNLRLESLLLMAECYRDDNKLEKSCEIWENLAREHMHLVESNLKEHCK